MLEVWSSKRAQTCHKSSEMDWCCRPVLEVGAKCSYEGTTPISMQQRPYGLGLTGVAMINFDIWIAV